MNLSLGIDLPALQKDANGAVSIIKGATVGLADAANKANTAIAGGTDTAAKGLGSLQTQFRAAQREALTLAAKYGSMSEAALQAAQRAGSLKDDLQDQKAIINAFSADSKFTVLAGAMQQAAGAASIVTGSMGLLGVKSQDAADMLLKVQSALALTSGLAQIKEMNASFVALSAVIKTSVIPSIVAMNLAMSVGIVAAIAVAVIAIYGIINNMNEEAESADRLAKKNKDLTDSIEGYAKAVAASASANLKVRSLEMESMKEGIAKDKEALFIKIAGLRQGVEADFSASNQTIYDSKRRAASLIAIQKIQANELLDINKKYQQKKAVIDKQQAPVAISGTSGMLTRGKEIADAFNNIIATRIKPIPIENFLNLNSAAPKIMADVSALNDVIRNSFVNTFVGLGEVIGNAVAGEYKDPFEAIKNLLLASLGSVLVALGTQMIIMGVGVKALIEGLKTLNPVLLIGGGVIMVAAGAAISNIAAKGMQSNSSSSSSGSSPSPSMGGGGGGYGLSTSGGYGGPDSLKNRLYGRDLLLVIDQQGRVKRR
jgi:hypothetical protein